MEGKIKGGGLNCLINYGGMREGYHASDWANVQLLWVYPEISAIYY
jgi:hypothetical protein